MTWRETKLSLQLLAEKRMGFVRRERARMAKEVEDSIAGQLAADIGKAG